MERNVRGPDLQDLHSWHAECLAGGHHARHQHVDPRCQLIELDTFLQHAECPLLAAHRGEQRAEHQRDVDDLTVVRDQGDVLVLREQQVLEMVEEMVVAGIQERLQQHPIEGRKRGMGVQVDSLQALRVWIDAHARGVVELQCLVVLEGLKQIAVTRARK